MAREATQPWFPRRLFSRAILVQVLFVLMLCAIAGIAGRAFFRARVLSQAHEGLQGTLQALALTLGPAETIAPDWCSRRSGELGLGLRLESRGGALLCESRLEAGDPSLRIERGVARGNYRLTGSMPLLALSRAFSTLDSWLIGFLVLITGTLTVASVWTLRALVFPVGRLLSKATAILENRATPLVDASEEFGREPYGEWSELESSLDDLGRDLQTKAETLDVEREAQATLMEAISDAIFAVDLEESPLFFNSRMALIADARSLKSGRRLWEIFRDPQLLEAFRGALEKGEAVSVPAIPIEPERKFYSVSVSPLRNAEHEIYGAVGIFHDVTELKLAEQIRIDFVANASHELRTPLTAIQGYAETLWQDLKDQRPLDPDFVETIRRNSQRLMNLVNDLLDLSSLESNATLQRTSVSTEEITGRVLEQMKSHLARKGHQIRTHYRASTVFADPARLEQVLVNLLDNAHKYTPAGGGIEIAWETESTGEATVLTISDTGTGIPLEYQTRLFERFYRVDKGRSRELGGTGLGLAIIKHILLRHGGSVSVRSAPGQGSSFICVFPGVRLGHEHADSLKNPPELPG